MKVFKYLLIYVFVYVIMVIYKKSHVTFFEEQLYWSFYKVGIFRKWYWEKRRKYVIPILHNFIVLAFKVIVIYVITFFPCIVKYVIILRPKYKP